MQTVNASPVQTINEQLPIIQQDDHLYVSAILLHRKLQVQTVFSRWFKRRCDQFSFEKNEDFLPNLAKSSGGRRATDYLLSIDMAKELAMLEENEIGRNIRRYFIEIEKRYRDWIGFILPRLEMHYDLFGQREGYNYLQLLKACGCSIKSGSRSARIRKNRQEFWRNPLGEVCVSEKYGKAIITNAIARRLNMETRERRLTYQSQSLEEKGGSHA